MSKFLSEGDCMSEKIAFASWNYIRLVCSNHGDELVLDEISGRPFYRCRTNECDLRISSALYEKVLDDVIALQNKGELLVGIHWKRKSDSKITEFSVISCANGKRPEISVRII